MPVKGFPSLAPLFTRAFSPIEEVDRERNGLELCTVASSAAYANENAMVMVLLVDEEAVKVTVVETVEEEAAIPEEERVSLEATAVETTVAKPEVTVVTVAKPEVTVVTVVKPEVTVVTVVKPEVTAASSVRW